MEISSTAALLYRGPGEVYSNQKQITQAILLGQSEQELVFNIEDTDQTVESVRLHLITGNPPVDVSYIKLYGLHVKTKCAESDKEKSLFSFNNAEELQKNTEIHGLALNKKILGELFIVAESDPNIELLLPAPVTVDSTNWLQVVVSIEYLFGDEYMLARDYFLVNQEEFEQNLRSMENDLAHLKSVEAKLATYRKSPFWTTFMSMHHAYERFLRLKEAGLINACTKVLQPSWWSKRSQNEYERWRTAKGYENREEQ